jgi:hypothetical protein
MILLLWPNFMKKLVTAYREPTLMSMQYPRSTDGRNSPLLHAAEVWSLNVCLMVSLHYICSDCSEETIVVLVVGILITLLRWKITPHICTFSLFLLFFWKIWYVKKKHIWRLGLLISYVKKLAANLNKYMTILICNFFHCPCLLNVQNMFLKNFCQNTF